MGSDQNQKYANEDILAAFSQLELGGDGPFVDGEYAGGECRVFKLSFQNRASVAVRVPHHAEDSSHESVISMLRMEVQVIRKLEEKGFCWAPKHLGSCLTFDNAMKRPFIVLTWAEGVPLSWDKDSPSDRTHRNKILSQIASIQLSLITCTLENRPTTIKAFYEKRLENRRIRVREGKIPSLSEKDCLDQQALLHTVLGHDQNSTAFAIDHGDIKPDNLIVDQENNIQCIIDWGFAAVVPIVRAACLPRFLWPDHLVGSAPSITTLEDREAYLRSISSENSLAAGYMVRWQAAKEVDFLTLYLESISSKGVHTFMARVRWKVPPDC